jgi:hypothetical protein
VRLGASAATVRIMAPIAPSTRRAIYNPVNSAGPFIVPFPVFAGDGVDLDVRLNNEILTGWSFSATTESGFYGAPNTWDDGRITLPAPVTGELVIKGLRQPRRQSQFAEGRGIPARDHNTELNILTALAQELRRDLNDAELPAILERYYLGEKTSDPTSDNDGNPLVGGALYSRVGQPNPLDNQLRLYRNGSWVSAISLSELPASSVTVDDDDFDFAASEVQTALERLATRAANFTGAAAGKSAFYDSASASMRLAYASPRDPTADLRDFLDSTVGVGLWTERTGVGVGTNCQPAAEAALDAIRARYGRGVLRIPPGTWLFNAELAPAKLSGIFVEGYGSQVTKLVYNKNSGAFLRWSAASAFTGGGIRGVGCLLEDGYPTSNAEFMRLEGDATNQPDQFRAEDLYVSAFGSSFWYQGLIAYGVARTSPQGIRIADLRNIQLFRNRNAAALFYNIVGWTIINLGSYSGSGGGNDVYLSGGGAANTNSIQVSIDGLWCSGDLKLSNASRCRLFGTAASVTAATSFTYHTGQIFAPSLSGSLGTPGNLLVTP